MAARIVPPWVVCLLLCSFAGVHAADRTWTGGGSASNWSTSDYWLDRVPANGATISYNASSTSHLNNTCDLALSVTPIITIPSGDDSKIFSSVACIINNGFSVATDGVIGVVTPVPANHITAMRTATDGL